MIEFRPPTSHPRDTAVKAAVDVFTQPMANTDPGQQVSTVVDDIQAWMDAERGSGGRTVEAGHVRYSVLAVLVAFYLLVSAKRPVSQAEAMRVLLYEMSSAQRAMVGMTADLAGCRIQAVIDSFTAATDEDALARIAHDPAVRRVHTMEYARFAKYFTAMSTAFDPSPFSKTDTLTRTEKVAAREHIRDHRKKKGTTTSATAAGEQALGRRRHRAKMTNALRNAVLADPSHPDRRIDDATVERNTTRLHEVMNKIVAASGLEAPIDGYGGDIAVDETIWITLRARAGHGTAADKLISADPDAFYWPGKNLDDSDEERGFGYGITPAIRQPRPYARTIPPIAVGIHIGRPTGGRTEPVRTAITHADRHGLTGTTRSRTVVADMGFTMKDEWLAMLHDLGYRTCADMPTNWNTDLSIDDVDAHGQPAIGPRIISGAIRCPGAHGLPKSAAPTPHNEQQGPETAEQVLDRHRKTAVLDALAMPVKEGLRPVKTGTRGRPREGSGCTDWAITVQCPAALGLVNCPLVLRADGLRDPDKPDVPTPPTASSPELLPRACRQDHVTYRLDNTTAKKLQPYTYGSFQWADMYRSLRSANERFHSQWKARSSGGVSHQWVQMRGIAKIGLLVAISTAVTNRNLIEDHRTKQIGPDGKAKFGPREEMRRQRQRIIKGYTH